MSFAEDSMSAAVKMQENSVGEIHSLYQDLFLTDIKKEVETAQLELKNTKQEQNSVQRQYAVLKKENTQLQATLKRYRRQLQELSWSQQKPTQAALNSGNLGKIGGQSKIDTQRNSMAGGSNTPRGHGSLKRQDSQSSIRSKQSAMTN